MPKRAESPQQIAVELDARELRSLHFASALLRDALVELAENAGTDLEALSPDGRRVHPADSALMKLEIALLAAGEDL